MSLLGIDVGTSGCKATIFSLSGEPLSHAYLEYDIRSPQPGWAELDAAQVWDKVKGVIARAAVQVKGDPVTALSVSSMGEAMVPVSAQRQILGPSILLSDPRGEAYLDDLRRALPDEDLYRVNGNTLGNQYSLPKLKWLKEHRPDEYARADKYLLWGGLVSYLLGAEAAVDYSLANRTLLFDLNQGAWSPDVCRAVGLDLEKLPAVCPSGTVIGAVSHAVARELGLPAGVALVAGAHDQCANAVGCGVIRPGLAVYGMGTYLCITPVFESLRPPPAMIARGLNTEHHAAPGLYVCFIYNQGGSLVKWFRSAFAGSEHLAAQAAGEDIYPALFAEMPGDPSSVTVLPLFGPSGPPQFIPDACGAVAGLRLSTTRGDILKGLVEGATFYLKACVDDLNPVGIAIEQFVAGGGGSKSDPWLQLSADILGRPVRRTQVAETGTLGAAMIAGVGTGLFASFDQAVAAMVRPGSQFEPDAGRQTLYAARYAEYLDLWRRLEGYLRGYHSRHSP